MIKKRIAILFIFFFIMCFNSFSMKLEATPPTPSPLINFEVLTKSNKIKIGEDLEISMKYNAYRNQIEDPESYFAKGGEFFDNHKVDIKIYCGSVKIGYSDIKLKSCGKNKYEREYYCRYDTKEEYYHKEYEELVVAEQDDYPINKYESEDFIIPSTWFKEKIGFIEFKMCVYEKRNIDGEEKFVLSQTYSVSSKIWYKINDGEVIIYDRRENEVLNKLYNA